MLYKHKSLFYTSNGAVVEDIYNFSLLNDLIYKISISNNIVSYFFRIETIIDWIKFKVPVLKEKCNFVRKFP